MVEVHLGMRALPQEETQRTYDQEALLCRTDLLLQAVVVVVITTVVQHRAKEAVVQLAIRWGPLGSVAQIIVSLQAGEARRVQVVQVEPLPVGALVALVLLVSVGLEQRMELEEEVVITEEEVKML